MSNHKWENNVCVICELRREMGTKKVLMAVTDEKPYDHYKSESKYFYWFDFGKTTFNRPPCKMKKYDSKSRTMQSVT